MRLFNPILQEQIINFGKFFNVIGNKVISRDLASPAISKSKGPTGVPSFSSSAYILAGSAAAARSMSRTVSGRRNPARAFWVRLTWWLFCAPVFKFINSDCRNKNIKQRMSSELLENFRWAFPYKVNADVGVEQKVHQRESFFKSCPSCIVPTLQRPQYSRQPTCIPHSHTDKRQRKQKAHSPFGSSRNRHQVGRTKSPQTGQAEWRGSVVV